MAEQQQQQLQQQDESALEGDFMSQELFPGNGDFMIDLDPRAAHEMFTKDHAIGCPAAQPAFDGMASPRLQPPAVSTQTTPQTHAQGSPGDQKAQGDTKKSALSSPDTESDEPGSRKRSASSKELEPKAWLKRRREQIARASRKAREKRRNQVSELQEENDRLRSERAGFLKKIEDLQLKVSEIRSSGGQVNIRMENDLLRAQLQEHKAFLSDCFKLHHGLPTPSNAVKNLHAQGSSFAKTYVHSLLSRSAREAWTPTKLPSRYFHVLSPGYDVTASHRLVNTPNNRSLSVRIDFAFKDLPLDALAEAYWRMWTDVGLIRQGFDIDFPIKLTTLEVPGQSAESFGAYCYQEDVSPPKRPAEWVYVTSRDREKVIKSTLALPPAQTPGLVRGLTREDAVAAWLTTTKVTQASGGSASSSATSAAGAPGAPSSQNVTPPAQPSASKEAAAAKPDARPKNGAAAAAARRKRESARKRGKRAARGEAALGTFGKTNGWILARCTTEHSPVESKEAARRRITSLLIEGGVLWEQGIICEGQDLEASFTGADDADLLVERETCTRLALVASMPLDLSMNILGSYKEVVHENGELTEKFCKALEMFYIFSRQIFQDIQVEQDEA